MSKTSNMEKLVNETNLDINFFELEKKPPREIILTLMEIVAAQILAFKELNDAFGKLLENHENLISKIEAHNKKIRESECMCKPLKH